MSKLMILKEAKTIDYEVVEERALLGNEVRIKTLYTGISAGTELASYRGSNPFLSKKWDTANRIFEKEAETSWSYPLKQWGYEEVGEIVEIGSEVKEVAVGDVIFGTWGHKSIHITDESFAKDRKLHKELDPICGIFSHIGAIGINAILDANIHVGETVAIFGQGVPGQIVTQLAKLNGARVIAIDLDDTRLSYAKKFGADIIINSGKCDTAKEIKEITKGLGADVAIEISGSSRALHEAIRCTAYSGRVVASGFFQGEAAGLFLGEEFHHNRIQLVCSQISGVDPALSYRWNRLRLNHTVMDLQKEGKLNLKGLITHVIPFEEAAKAYEMLDKGTEEVLQIVLSLA
ncbi:2-desacetyl-2-hydroxyethyl bacteriochlorophyllide A dehydrogenase [Geosporobacter subterraneus DSM 17957]|uniref:2-desacetyl-2-hydroxyethyl bacteriochlorophyllide A dehydrogenase n=1 Tax=Geosporobacter subterraneus DSM 17957 TaxID=1121919 RepID=A0A1M6MMJ6_9FIRM|nr:zinc-binding alcohol dehydrogenase [Geosporobacter subterraneus]SHJ84503.1 2-desacetyl-2-hydroxyethyl bacteriochlorophyllide A dehydrogenase [Geosporobacter subterraneus DSM 17957]